MTCPCEPSDSPLRDRRSARSRTRRRPQTVVTVASVLLLVARLHPYGVSAGAAPPSSPPYRYNICNGLSNQLLYHASNIALAIQSNRSVEVPNYFIVDGVQHSDANVIPSPYNSVPFGVAFDAEYFLSSVRRIGNIAVTLVDFSFDAPQLECHGMASVHKARPDTTLSILQSFRPSRLMQETIDSIQAKLNYSLDQGICLHHRDGLDWHEHCARWSAIPDGIYRGNCLLPSDTTLIESLRRRSHETAQWIFYAGDHDVPEDLRSGQYTVVTRNQLMQPSDVEAMERLTPTMPTPREALRLAPPARNQKPVSFLQSLGRCVTGYGCGKQPPPTTEPSASEAPPSTRDLWALIDFFICRNIHGFVGNSVSTFSALQIAMREGENAYWYNSQSIPLAGIWQTYWIPIVYTYSEHSEYSDKHLLQASIVSVQTHMPRNKIHVLYHGTKDQGLKRWLQDQKVQVHEQSLGGATGTWTTTQLLQRLEIPQRLHSEYILLLDTDTLVLRPFTLADFGQDLTRTIAMSSAEMVVNRAENEGVVLMNVPYMRSTWKDFAKFVEDYVERSPSSPIADRRAYLEFYNASFLPRPFNFKPFWDKQKDIMGKSPFIAHFYKAKPHGYIKHCIGDPCMVRKLCDKALLLPSLCQVMQAFAKATKTAVLGQSQYCLQSFPNQTMALVCDEVLDELALVTGDCTDLPAIVRRVLERKGVIYADLQSKLFRLNQQVDRLRREQRGLGQGQLKRLRQQSETLIRSPSTVSHLSSILSFLLPWSLIAISVFWHYEKKRRLRRKLKLTWRGFSSASPRMHR